MEIGDRAGILLVGRIKAFKKITRKAVRDFRPKLFGILAASNVIFLVTLKKQCHLPLWCKTASTLCTVSFLKFSLWNCGKYFFSVSSGMFSIKFMGPVIISVIILPKFLASASLKNYGKNPWKISPDPLSIMLNIGLKLRIVLVVWCQEHRGRLCPPIRFVPGKFWERTAHQTVQTGLLIKELKVQMSAGVQCKFWIGL